MNIWYAVNSTGNGHITRARIMAVEFKKVGIEVQFMFTGRPASEYFDMDIFGDYKVCDGLTFAIDNGQVKYFKTVLRNNIVKFISNVMSLDLSEYDLVISDFEPVTAWAAKIKGIPVLGIGHQYAFEYDIPKAGSNLIADNVMKFFAPVTTGIGLHWHHFNQPILPPIIDTQHFNQSPQHNKIVVYLPFEDQQSVIKLLAEFDNFVFHVYAPDSKESGYDHILCKLPSREGFTKDVRGCVGVICNAGFELASEALLLGKKILVKPVQSQMEQISNAQALSDLDYGYVMNHLDSNKVADWLELDYAVKVSYPNVAELLVKEIQNGMPTMTGEYISQAWDKVIVTNV